MRGSLSRSRGTSTSTCTRFAPVGYLTISKDSVIEEGNLTVGALLGVDRHQLIKDRFRKFVATEDRERWDRYFLSVLQSAEKRTIDLPVLKGDGSRFHAQAEGIRIEREKKDPVVRIAITDITAQKRAEEQLKIFRTFTENAQDIILFIRKHDGKIIGANRKADEVYGFSHEELLGMTVFSLRAYNPESLVREQMDRADASGILFETVHRRKDGSELPVEVNSFSLQLDGEPVLFSIVRDVTERKRAEEQLRYNALIIDEIEDAIISTKNDEGFTVTNWNPGAEKMYGWKKAEVMGRRSTIFHTEFPGGDRDTILKKLLKTGKFEGETIQFRKDGTRIIVDSRVTGRRDRPGQDHRLDRYQPGYHRQKDRRGGAAQEREHGRSHSRGVEGIDPAARCRGYGPDSQPDSAGTDGSKGYR